MVELLVALTLGLVMLSVVVAFFFNTSRTITMGQKQAQAQNKAELALQKMVQAIKGANTEPPPLFAFSPAWNQLPALPYMAGELSPYPTTSGIAVEPTVPAARKFAAQLSLTDKDHKWCPNPDQDPSESNSLVFYHAPQPGPGNTAQVERITYRLEATSPNQGRLIKETQRPITSASLNFASSPAPTREVIVDNVLSVQFTYPLLLDRLQQPSPVGSDFHDDLNTMQTTQGNDVLQGYLNQGFRKIIKIHLVIAGAERQGTPMRGIELETEVRLRNE